MNKILDMLKDHAAMVNKGDYEAAHSIEDDIMHHALRLIAGTPKEDPAVLAALALSALSLEYPRWCA